MNESAKEKGLQLSVKSIEPYNISAFNIYIAIFFQQKWYLSYLINSICQENALSFNQINNRWNIISFIPCILVKIVAGKQLTT